MKKMLFNIQLFATANEDVTTTNKTSTLRGRMSVEEAHEYYDRTLNRAVYDTYTFHQYFDVLSLPKNNGDTMVLRKAGKYKAKMNPLIEGVIPEQDGPLPTYEYRVQLQDYAGYTTFTDKMDIYSLNSGWGTMLQEEQAGALGEELQKKAYEIMLTSKNHWFAGVSSPSGDLADVRANVKTLQLDDFRKIRPFLQRAKVKPYDGTNFLVLISPEVASTMFSLKKSGNSDDYTFIEILNAQQDKKVFSGEIGTWFGFKFVVDPTIKNIWTATDSDTNTINIHGCLILGKYRNQKGAKLVKLDGYGKPETIIKDTTSGGARENPVNQIGSIGWKMYGWGGTVLYSEAVMVYECSADAATGEFEDADRDQLVNGTDGNGTSYDKPVANDMYSSGTKLTDKTLVVNWVQGIKKGSKVDGSIAGTYLYDADTLVSTLATTLGVTLYDATGTALTTTKKLSEIATGNIVTVYSLIA